MKKSYQRKSMWEFPIFAFLLKAYALLIKYLTTIQVPYYKELAKKQIWEFVKQIPKLAKNFSDFKDKEFPDRSYLLEVLETLRTAEWIKLVDDASKDRSKDKSTVKYELIEVNPEILKKLMSIPTLAHGELIY